jgi:cation diffusion facilitator family transporter
MSPRAAAALSVLAACVTAVLKACAYAVTGSAGLFSDALESGVNLLAALAASVSLWYSARPADATHAYGHAKIEFLAAGFEGTLILVAGLGTAGFGVARLLQPQPLEHLGLGSLIATLAAALNLAVGMILLRSARRHRSPVLEADAHHLLADVFTTVGVLAGLGLVAATGAVWLDALLAAGVGLWIVLTGLKLLRRSFDGLMDRALPPAEQEALRAALRASLPPGADFHALRTRRAGPQTFAEFHLLLRGNLSVRAAHAAAHRVEEKLLVAFPGLAVTVHIEPIDEPTSWEADELARLGEPAEPKTKTEPDA